MAFFDDKKFLLSHIRHSFITCDDTGVCEMSMLNEPIPNRTIYGDDPDAQFLDGQYPLLCNITNHDSFPSTP